STVISSAISQIYEVSVAEISAGYTRSLKSNEKVNFSIFDFEGGQHLLTISEVGVDYVNLVIESNPINLTLGVGQSVKLNLTSKVYYDLLVKVNKIVEGEAELTIQLINEPIEVRFIKVVTTEETEDAESRFPIIMKNLIFIEVILFTVFTLTIAFIFIVLIVFRLNRKKLKTEKTSKKGTKKNEKKTKS
ncbi:MAG: hypothetical protein KAR54_02705, partial [Candidatus Pacebacteria bacterium]|nr:hypothetical protein [Candidatus Paceibacterota bacterium]